MTFDEWLAIGYGEGWVAEGCCATHDGTPMTPEEDAQCEAGGDPCIPVLRVWGPAGPDRAFWAGGRVEGIDDETAADLGG